MNERSVVLITMGDPNGVGPEICARLLTRKLSRSGKIFPVIVGDVAVLQRALDLIGSHRPVRVLRDLAAHDWDPAAEIAVWDGGCPFSGTVTPGSVSRKAGEASIAWVRRAAEEILAGRAAAMVTAPICKESVEKSVPGFQGHTEYIGALCGDPHPVLTLVHGKWVVAHVSTHVSLKEAVERVSRERIAKVGVLLDDFLRRYRGLESPRIGIAGLNPHAGEGGLFGQEEIGDIVPAVRDLRRKKILAEGPLPGDVIFPRLRCGDFDGVVAMYHDQGHIVTKTLAFSLGKRRRLNGVNLTLGLPVLRTSVDHGTGFDIAWRGVADEHSLADAWNLAVRLITKRK